MISRDFPCEWLDGEFFLLITENSLPDIRRPEYSILRDPFSTTFSISLYPLPFYLITISLTPCIRYTIYVGPNKIAVPIYSFCPACELEATIFLCCSAVEDQANFHIIR